MLTAGKILLFVLDVWNLFSHGRVGANPTTTVQVTQVLSSVHLLSFFHEQLTPALATAATTPSALAIGSTLLVLHAIA